MIRITEKEFDKLKNNKPQLVNSSIVKDAKSIKFLTKQPKTTKTSTKEIQVKESTISRQIYLYLQYHGWYVIRLNSGMISLGEGENKRFFKGSEKGTPDLMAFKTVNEKLQLVFIEIKRANKKPTDWQRIKMEQLRKYGARCIVAHSIDDIQKLLEQNYEPLPF